MREGSIDIRYPFRTDGEYLLRLNAYATLAGPEPPRMQISLNGKPVKTFEVKEREDERRDFVVKLKPGKGVHQDFRRVPQQLREQRLAGPGVAWRPEFVRQKH